MERDITKNTEGSLLSGEERSGLGGIRLKSLNRVMISVTIALASALVVIAFFTIRSFRNVEQSTEQYVLARQDSAQMQDSSDYLTDRARIFIVTGDRSFAEDYFREIEVTRRRDLAVESMEKLLSGNSTALYLGYALDESNKLAEVECYAMRLAVAGHALDLEDFPAALKAVALKDEDRGLSAEQQLELAQEMVFGEAYLDSKDKIRVNISHCEQALIDETQAMLDRSSDRFQSILTIQLLLILVVPLVVALIVICIARLVIRPIEKMIGAISCNSPVAEEGAHELRFMGRTYNRFLELNRQNQADLAYKASHDPLTDLYNRGAFEKAKEAARRRAQALLIIDVDSFKTFNDTYGHDMGDRILKKVSQTLRHNFRTEDYVCRIGGDEFAVLMLHVNSAMRPLVEQKIQNIREMLRDGSDGTPVVTLSIGVAFSDRPDPTDDILKDADTALYQVKERGRNGYAFYGDKP